MPIVRGSARCGACLPLLAWRCGRYSSGDATPPAHARHASGSRQRPRARNPGLPSRGAWYTMQSVVRRADSKTSFESMRWTRAVRYRPVPAARAPAAGLCFCRTPQALRQDVSPPAWWQSGYAADCKSAYAGSIPTQASISFQRLTVVFADPSCSAISWAVPQFSVRWGYLRAAGIAHVELGHHHRAVSDSRFALTCRLPPDGMPSHVLTDVNGLDGLRRRRLVGTRRRRT